MLDLSWRKWNTLGVLVVAVLGGCGPSGRDQGDDTGGHDGGNGDGNGNVDTCSDASKLVYVVDESNQLSTFDPATKTFHDIGALSCPAQFLATPFSMAIDRDTNAWVLYNSGELFKVNTTTRACTATSWHTQLGLAEFGMGFSTETAGGSVDKLFIAGGSDPMATSSKLATLDTTTMGAVSQGNVTGWPELTGTGSAELWGFFPDPTTPRVEKINKASGAALTTYPLPAGLKGTPMAWAFAFWGGDFWVFLMKSTDSQTTVYQINGTNGQLKGMTVASGRHIVGAGVSTCAPTVIL